MASLTLDIQLWLDVDGDSDDSGEFPFFDKVSQVEFEATSGSNVHIRLEKAICGENATNGRSASGWNHWIWLSGTIMIGKADTILKPRPAQSYPPSQSGFAFKFENGLVHAATPSPNVKFNWVPCRHWMGDGIGLCRLFGGEISACFLCPEEGRKGEPTNQPTCWP